MKTVVWVVLFVGSSALVFAVGCDADNGDSELDKAALLESYCTKSMTRSGSPPGDVNHDANVESCVKDLLEDEVWDAVECAVSCQTDVSCDDFYACENACVGG